MNITIIPMLAEPSFLAIFPLILAIMGIAIVGILGLALVVFVLNKVMKPGPVTPSPIQPSAPTVPANRSSAKKILLWLLVAAGVAAVCVFIGIRRQKSNADVLTPSQFFSLVDSNKIVAATIFEYPPSPLKKVAGVYKKRDSAGDERTAYFTTPKMGLTDELVSRVMKVPQVDVRTSNKALSSVVFTILPLWLIALVLLFIVGFLIFLAVRVLTNNRTSSSPIPPVHPISSTESVRQCPKCGTLLKSDVPEGLCPACLLQRGIATEGGAPPGTPPFTPPPLLEIAKLFPQLEILEVIGQGGMGAVYKARQPALDRFVALKILAPRSGGDLDFAGRFSREARALAKLSHPNIVAVYDFGQIVNEPESSVPSTPDARPLSYFIMEYVDGPNLRQLEQGGKLTPREALQIIPQICAALQFAHDEGIVHRDIKPENVLLDKKGRVKIADFGLAKILGQEADFRLTGARDVMGTPHYMAPEQVEKPQEVDHRADIYSLGVVFYEMLTGELPLGKFDPPSHKVQIDVRLDDVVLRSLANNPARRYQHVSEVKTEVETIASNANPTKPQPNHSGSRIGLIVLGASAVAVAILLLGLLVVIGVPTYIEGKARREAQALRERAERNTADLMAAQKAHAVSRILTSTNPPASAETWAPTLAPGEKPDLSKILEDAKAFTQRGQYEEALGRYIWFHKHEREYGDSYENVVRITSALSDWVELGRRYPKARQALVEIRDATVREIAEGRGYVDLFTDVQAINRELQDNDATYALFLAMRKGDPQLASQCYYWVENLLVSKGDYQWCYDHMGDPQARLSQAKESFDMQIRSQKQMAELHARSDKQFAELNRQRGLTNAPTPYFPDTSETLSRSATNSFVGAVDTMIEILVGTGHLTDATRIRDQALAVFDDPRLHSAISAAQERIQKRLPSKTELEKVSEQTNSALATLSVQSPAQKANSSTNPTDASRETWAPSLAPGEQPDLLKIQQEAKDLMLQNHYEEALQRHIWYHNHSLLDPAQAGVRNSFALSDWIELGRRYPKAMRALIEIRDENTRKISSGEGYFDLFLETASINRELGNEESTRALFKQLAASPDKNLAQQCYSAAQGVLVSHGDYGLCMNFIGEPEKRFKTLQDQWQRSKKSEQQQDDMRRQMDERIRAMHKQPESNGIAAASWQPLVMPSPPKMADKTFVAQTRQLIEILLGAGHKNDAEKIRDEAISLLDDPGLKSAVDDAEKTIHDPKPATSPNRAPSLGMVAMPPPAAPPPAIQPPQSGGVIRPLRTLPERSLRPTN